MKITIEFDESEKKVVHRGDAGIFAFRNGEEVISAFVHDSSNDHIDLLDLVCSTYLNAYLLTLGDEPSSPQRFFSHAESFIKRVASILASEDKSFKRVPLEDEKPEFPSAQRKDGP